MGASVNPSSCRYTARQSQILTLAAGGLSDKEIALQLALSVSTVRAHLQRFYRVNGAQNRAEAVAIWVRSQVSAEPSARS